MLLLKINNTHKAVIEWIIAVLLVITSYKFSPLSYGSFSPLKAHELSERTYHYGPSKIIKTIDFDGKRIYLCKYKDWFSADTVKKGLIKWYPDSNVAGTPIEPSKQISFSFGGRRNKQDKMDWEFYGCVTDPDITKVQLVLKNEVNPFSYDLDESKMFIFYWIETNPQHTMNYLRGLDKDGKIIYEKEFN